MKSIFTSLLCLLILSASTCKKEGEDCHYYIQIKNNSANQIIAAIPVLNADSKCRLDGKSVNKGEQYDFRPFNFCIENSMTNNDTLEIYIVDPGHYNDPGVYYCCDSIEYYNTVLNKYVLTLEDLKRNNFTISYP